MKFGIVGNREGFTYEYVKSKLEYLNIYKSDVIISGGAEGVDTFAQQYAKEKGCKLVIHYPDPNKPSPDRYFERNQKIVHDSDIIIAFNKNEKSGTINTINYAKKVDKKVEIFNGNVC